MRSTEARKLARVILAAATQCGLTFRVFGGAGVMLLYGNHPTSHLFREDTGDIDLVGRYDQQPDWVEFFKKLSFDEHSRGGEAQWEFRGVFRGRSERVHVYSDPMRFSEVVPGPYFTAEWPETIPPTALLLSKLLVQREYDWGEQFQDIASAMFALGGAEPAHQLDQRYIVRSLFSGFAGWRRWLLVERSLSRFEEGLDRAGTEEIENQVRSGLVHLRRALTPAPADWPWRFARRLHASNIPLMPVHPVGGVEPLADS